MATPSSPLQCSGFAPSLWCSRSQELAAKSSGARQLVTGRKAQVKTSSGSAAPRGQAGRRSKRIQSWERAVSGTEPSPRVLKRGTNTVSELRAPKSWSPQPIMSEAQ